MKKIQIIVICALIGFSCKKEDNPKFELNQTKISLFSEESEKVDVTSDNEVSYVSENEFHATVTNKGLVTAVKVGETFINVSNNIETKKIAVEVLPKYETYPTPTIYWGLTMGDVTNIYGVPDYSDLSEGVLGYVNYSDKAEFIDYWYDKNGAIEACVVWIPYEHVPELKEYIKERYYYLFNDQDNYAYVYGDAVEDEDVRLLVAYFSSVDYYGVLYQPLNDSNLKSKSVIGSKLNSISKYKRGKNAMGF